MMQGSPSIIDTFINALSYAINTNEFRHHFRGNFFGHFVEYSMGNAIVFAAT